MSFPKRWWGKLFHSLMILMKKEYLKAFTFADFMRILNKLLDLVLLFLVESCMKTELMACAKVGRSYPGMSD